MRLLGTVQKVVFPLLLVMGCASWSRPCLADVPSLAVKLFGEAEESARTIPDVDDQGHVLRLMVLEYFRQGERARAEQLAHHISSLQERDQAFRVLSALLAGEKNVAEALRLRAFIGNDFDLAWTAGVIVWNQAQSEGPEAALQTAMTFPEGEIRGRAMYGLASAQLLLRDFDGGRRTIRRMPENEQKGEILSQITEEQLNAGQFKEVLETAQTESEREGLRRRIESRQAQAGEISEVVQRLDGIQDADIKDEVLESLVIRYVRDGSLDRAKQMAGKIVKQTVQRRTWREVVPLWAEAGHVEEALEIARGITDNYDREMVIRGIILQVASHLDVSQALQILAAHQAFLKFMTSHPDQFGFLLSQIAEQRLRVGDTTGARRAIEQAGNDRHKEWALVEIAVEQAKTGDLKASRETLAEVSDPERWSWRQGIEHIIEAHGHGGQFDEAKELVRRIPDVIVRAESSKRVALWQVRAGQIENALAWAHELPTPEERAFALFGAGLGMLQNFKTETPSQK